MFKNAYIKENEELYRVMYLQQNLIIMVPADANENNILLKDICFMQATDEIQNELLTNAEWEGITDNDLLEDLKTFSRG